MKTSQFKKIIKEAVREAVREELVDLFTSQKVMKTLLITSIHINA